MCPSGVILMPKDNSYTETQRLFLDLTLSIMCAHLIIEPVEVAEGLQILASEAETKTFA